MAISIGTPAAHRKPRTALARPAIDSTERSISPAMMISVIGRAMIATSMRAAMRFAKLPAVRKNGESGVPITISAEERRRRSSVSQRASDRGSTGARRSRLVAALIGRAVAAVGRWKRRRMSASALTARRITTP